MNGNPSLEQFPSVFEAKQIVSYFQGDLFVSQKIKEKNEKLKKKNNH
jgi:hypothetical protein